MKKQSALLAETKLTLEKELAQIVIENTAEGGSLQKLSEIVAELNLGFETGRISSVGRNSSGSNSVSFTRGNSTFISNWPQWAFEQARSALLYGKEVTVIFDGIPLGNNLLSVLVLEDSV